MLPCCRCNLVWLGPELIIMNFSTVKYFASDDYLKYLGKRGMEDAISWGNLNLGVNPKKNLTKLWLPCWRLRGNQGYGVIVNGKLIVCRALDSNQLVKTKKSKSCESFYNRFAWFLLLIDNQKKIDGLFESRFILRTYPREAVEEVGPTCQYCWISALIN